MEDSTPTPWRLGGLAAAFSFLAMTAGCRSSPVKSAKVETPAWYSAEPLLVSLHSDARAGLEARLGVRALEELPLYDLDVSVDLAAAKFTLQEEVWLTNTSSETWADVVLRLYANVPAERAGKAPPMQLASGTCPQVGSCAVTLETPTAIRVRPAVPLAPGGRLRVSLALAGTLEKIDGARTSLLAQGLEGMQSLAAGTEGTGNYGLLAIGDGIASFGNFYAVLARRTSGGWERAEKSGLGDLGSDEMSHVRARVEVPLAAKVASSGVVTAEEPAGVGRRAVRVAAAAVRDFAFVTSDAIDAVAVNVGDVVVRSYFRKSERVAGERVLSVAAASLADYGRRFGRYPYPALGVAEAAIVGGAGGVEFSGLVTIASMLYKPGDEGGDGPGLGGLLGSSPGGGPTAALTDGMLEFVVAHEVAHQYWHGLVGSDSREHPFMDEALAQYSALLYLEDRYGRERADKDGMLNVEANYQMMRILGTADAPVDRPVDAFGSSIEYAGLVYGKAPYFFAALRRTMGDQAFFAALEAYVQKYAFRVAPSPALADTFAPGDPRIAALSARWLREAHGDEDLGQPDLAKIMAAVLGPDGMKEMGPMLQMLGGKGGAGGIDLKEMLKQLQR